MSFLNGVYKVRASVRKVNPNLDKKQASRWKYKIMNRAWEQERQVRMDGI